MDKAILKRFSKKVKELRKKRNLTQQELAELSDLEYKYIQRIEGKNPPSIGLAKLVKLAKALKISSSRFLKSIE